MMIPGSGFVFGGLRIPPSAWPSLQGEEKADFHAQGRSYLPPPAHWLPHPDREALEEWFRWWEGVS